MKNYKLLPKITLWVLLLLGIVATIMFFVGGTSGSLEVAGDYLSIPRFTDLFLIWCYILLGIVILVTIGVVIWEFCKNCKYDKRSAITSLVVVVGFVGLILLCWFLGSPEKVNIIGYEGTDNVGAMAQMSDAIIYLCYILMAATIGTLIWGVIYTKRLK
ncbi:MAG: hypothetical protein ACI30A_06085 [Paludibacteraceae bacterium]